MCIETKPRTEKEMDQALQVALSSPSAQVGRRLRSETELADVFNVGRWHVRRSIDKLVGKGIVVRRRGSGTYVRRILDVKSLEGAASLGSDEHVPSEELFADAGNGDDVRPAEMGSLSGSSTFGARDDKCLHIGLWADLHHSLLAHQKLLAYLAGHIGRLGHRLTVHSMVEGVDSPLPVQHLTEQLRRTPCDGYIVPAHQQEVFFNAMGPTRRFVQLWGFSNFGCGGRPTIFFDVESGIRQTVKVLADEGYRRIGLIRLDQADINAETEVGAYRQAMLGAGLDYHAIVSCGASVSEGMAAARRMLSLDDPPEAIYVSDDYVMVGVAEALAIDGVRPGRDIGVISMNTPDKPLPEGPGWSRMEFSVRDFAETVVDNLLRMIRNNEPGGSTMAIQARWIPGRTHLKDHRGSTILSRSDSAQSSQRTHKATISVNA